jgi:hypothetical protein
VLVDDELELVEEELVVVVVVVDVTCTSTTFELAELAKIASTWYVPTTSNV